jgi:hypothetical protein
VKRHLKKLIEDPKCAPGRRGYFLLCLAYFEGMVPCPPFARGMNISPQNQLDTMPKADPKADEVCTEGIAELLKEFEGISH